MQTHTLNPRRLQSFRQSWNEQPGLNSSWTKAIGKGCQMQQGGNPHRTITQVLARADGMYGTDKHTAVKCVQSQLYRATLTIAGFQTGCWRITCADRFFDEAFRLQTWKRQESRAQLTKSNTSNESARKVLDKEHLLSARHSHAWHR